MRDEQFTGDVESLRTIPNKTVQWVVKNAPNPKLEGEFFSYAFVFKGAYGYVGDHCGTQVRSDLEKYMKPIFDVYGIGIQLGVQSHGHRGIRVINLR